MPVPLTYLRPGSTVGENHTADGRISDGANRVVVDTGSVLHQKSKKRSRPTFTQIICLKRLIMYGI